MLQACAQAVDFKVGHHFGEGQVLITHDRETLSLCAHCKKSRAAF
jgi:hypothetical protein